MPTLILLPNINAADHALNKLYDLGIPAEDISIAALEEHTQKWAEKNNPSGKDGANATQTIGETLGGAVSGGALGGIIGLLTGVAALTIPGLGGLLITGPLAAALGIGSLGANTVAGASIGGAIGGVSGLAEALSRAGVSEEESESIQTTLKEGGVLIAVAEGNEQLADKLEEVDYESIVTV